MPCGPRSRAHGRDVRPLHPVLRMRPRPKGKVSTELLDASEVQGSENVESLMFGVLSSPFEWVSRVPEAAEGPQVGPGCG